MLPVDRVALSDPADDGWRKVECDRAVRLLMVVKTPIDAQKSRCPVAASNRTTLLTVCQLF